MQTNNDPPTGLRRTRPPFTSRAGGCSRLRRQRSALCTMTPVAAWLVARRGGWTTQRQALAWVCFAAVLNFAWWQLN